MKSKQLIYKVTYENISSNKDFRNVLNETRKDVTFLYKYKYAIEDPSKPK